MIAAKHYVERVYAGLLGKLIGVYLGRPFEMWSHARITAELGDIRYYVHERLNQPLVVTDDDISGTLIFLRALADYDHAADLTPAQIGQTWLNYIVENQTVLWWGGLGVSTEHTAYLRLKHGLVAPLSGRAATNGQVVAEQIGAQIFIDGWALVAPGDPERAADLARRAASVSHDGEAIYGAQVIAAMEALAFVEPNLERLWDTAVGLIPHDAVIYRMIADLRAWRAGEPDWRAARRRLEARYGNEQYGGGCHIVPNHGVVQLALLYGQDDFQTSLMIANTCGWDTDCNSGNVGCLMGIKNGLAGMAGGPDWRGPVADRLYLPSADGGGVITDALREAYRVANSGLRLAGQPALAPKAGARFHFEAPGAVQGFEVDRPHGGGAWAVQNVRGHSQAGERSLALQFRALGAGEVRRATTPTFLPAADWPPPNAYLDLVASPTVNAGQLVRARLSADAANAGAVVTRVCLQVYGSDDQLVWIEGPDVGLTPGAEAVVAWRVPDTGGAPIARIGAALQGVAGGATAGAVYLDYLTWDGPPQVVWTRPAGAGQAWRRAWVAAVSAFGSEPEPLRLVQNEGTGLLIQGTREWDDYTVTADVTPHLAAAVGLAARVQGLRRYYALVLVHGGRLQLVKALDGDQVLAESAYPWEFGATYTLGLTVRGNHLTASVNGQEVCALTDAERPLLTGAVALVITEGRTATQRVTVGPLDWAGGA